MVSLPPPNVWRRAGYSGGRLAGFARALAFGRVDGALLFASAGLSFLEKGMMAVVARRAGKRVVFCPRSGRLLDDLERSRLMRKFVPFALSHCDAIVCQGTAWRSTFHQLTDFADEQLPIVLNWIDSDRYDGKRVAATGKPTTFLYLGWLEPYKGIFDLIEAVSIFREDLTGSRVIVCGAGSAAAEAQARAAASGVSRLIEFRGWVSGSSKKSVLRETDVLVLPSHREGLPNAVLEAMASRIPVIATPVGGIGDVILHEGLGVLVPPHSPEALGRAMVELGADPIRRQRMAAAGRDHVVRCHSVDSAWPKMLSILDPENQDAERSFTS